jgi:UDP-MurNAc hydroxylase
VRARYIYSACIVIETPDARICCDPWFTPGVYDGSWYQYPPLPGDPVELIGPVEVIYLSHIHPDHYDVAFLRRYLAAYPDTRLAIGELEVPHLARKMRIDGFNPEIVHTLRLGGTTLTIVANHSYSAPDDGVDDVDTALVVTHGDESVVNMNDNFIDEEQIAAVLAACPGRPSVAFLPYAGAGPYPQTYLFADPADLASAAAAKRERFLELFDRHLALLDPAVAVPFAGQYFLGGPLRELNAWRGSSDAVEAARRHPGRAFVLADGGQSYVDCGSLAPSATRTEPYAPEVIAAYLGGLAFPGYDYEREILPLAGRSLPLLPLLSSAYARAISRARVREPFWFCLSTAPGTFYCFDTSSDTGVSMRSEVVELEPRCEIFIDPRYLFGLLTRLYHWNNAEVGSQYRARRVPEALEAGNAYRRDAFSFLYSFQV